jgi:hypothetical protein
MTENMIEIHKVIHVIDLDMCKHLKKNIKQSHWEIFTFYKIIECLSKVLNGTPVACGSGIGRGPDVISLLNLCLWDRSTNTMLKKKRTWGIIT